MKLVLTDFYFKSFYFGVDGVRGICGPLRLGVYLSLSEEVQKRVTREFDIDTTQDPLLKY